MFDMPPNGSKVWEVSLLIPACICSNMGLIMAPIGVENTVWGSSRIPGARALRVSPEKEIDVSIFACHVRC